MLLFDFTSVFVSMLDVLEKVNANANSNTNKYADMPTTQFKLSLCV